MYKDANHSDSHPHTHIPACSNNVTPFRVSLCRNGARGLLCHVPLPRFTASAHTFITAQGALTCFQLGLKFGPGAQFYPIH